MSRKHTEKIKCPACGAESEFEMWDSINTMLDPDMKEKVRTDEAFRWTCPSCGHTTIVRYTTLYHQMEDRVMIWLVYGDRAKAVETMRNIRREVSKSESGEAGDRLMRVVADEKAFHEKLMILDAGLDDRVIELVKLSIRIYFAETDRKKNIGDIWFDGEASGEKSFVVRTKGDKYGSIAFSADMYRAIEADFREEIDREEDVFVVDLEWAMDMMNKKQQQEE